MSSIKLLSKQLASQIAAGEVVERPASVVKELVENAVDAHGTHILCEIRGAGKNLIRVRDNGTGIVKDELPLALAPHATSKISSVDDLNEIRTLGFRGEALASIASVSKLTLTSKTDSEENAFCVKVEGPEQNPIIMPAAHPNGTTVDVYELFFNTPARRRFLKSDRTEFMRIKDTFVRVALAHPELGFELISDSKCIFRVNKAQSDNSIDHKRTAILIGSDFSSEGIRVICEDPHLKIEGMLLPPPREEESLSDQIYLFLNGRPIADRVVTHALKEGFFEVLGKSLPIRCVLYLSIDPKEVDVNVHPRKDEVRFHETSIVHDLVTDSIVLALRKAGISPDNSCIQSELDYVSESIPTQDNLFATTDNLSVSPHVSSYSINDESLPAFPQGVQSAFIDMNAVTDRGVPTIIKDTSSYHQNTNTNQVESFNQNLSTQSIGPSGCIQTPKSFEKRDFDKENINKNINLYKANVNASNLGLNAATNINLENGSDHYVYSNGIEVLDSIDTTTVLIKSDSKYYLLNTFKLDSYIRSLEYAHQVQANNVQSFAFTIPYILKIQDGALIKGLKNCSHALAKCGFQLAITTNRVEVKNIPLCLKGTNLANYATQLFSCINEMNESIDDGECPDELSCIVGENSTVGKTSVSYQELLERVDTIQTLINQKNIVLELNLKQLALRFGENHEK